MLKSNSFIFLLVCCCSFFLAQSQEKRKQLPLKSILQNMGQTHHVHFNYLEDEIVVFTVLEPETKWTLAEKISYLKQETKLNFSVTNNQYYNVFNDKRLDKPLCGYVLNLETNEPIAQANITIVNTTITATSQENGYFELPIASGNNILLSHVSFEKTAISPESIYATNCPKIFLKPNIILLEEVITQTYLTSGISIKNDGTIHIKPKKIGHLPGLTEPDVFKTMQQIPGIISVDESISNINVRGGTHDQNLVVWNGIRLFQTGHFFGMISALNPNLAHTIKIAKNGTSAFYGESTSSVIDISTQTQEIEKSKGAIGVNWVNADFYTKLKTGKKSNLEVSGRRAFTDVINKSPTYKNYSNRIFQDTEVTNTSDNQTINYTSNVNFCFYDFTAQFHQKIGNKTDIFFDAITIYNQLNLDQSKIEGINTISRSSFLDQNTLGGNLGVKSEWNTKNTLEANVYTSYYLIDSKNESIENNQIFNQKNDIIDTGIRIQNNYMYSEKMIFKTGYQFNEIGISNTDRINSPLFYRKNKNAITNHALIAEGNYASKAKKLKTTLGFRANYFETLSKFRLEPRVQLHYQFAKNFALGIMGEAKNQTTSQIVDLQKDFLGIEKRRWIVSNKKNIPIIKSQQASVGITFKKNKWLGTFDNFYKKVAGITSMSQGFQNQLEFETLNGNYTVLGTELLLQKQISHFTTWISYSYTNNDYEFKSYTPSVFPNNYEISQNVVAAIIYDNQKLKLAVGAKYHSGKPTTNPVFENSFVTNPPTTPIQYQLPNSENLEDYFQLNCSVGYVFHANEKSNLNIGFAFENVTNQKNTINQHYRINANTNTIERVSTFSLERTLNAFMRYSF